MRAASLTGVGVLAVWAVGVAGGCAGSKPGSGTSLAQLTHPVLHVMPLDILDAANHEVMGIAVEHDDCGPPPASLTASVTTMNGTSPMELVWPGGGEGEAPDGGCTMPTFRTPSYIGRPAGDVTFTVTDGTTTFSMVVQSLFADRQALVTAPTGASGRAGQFLVLQWLPATDRFDPALSPGYLLEFAADGAATPTWVITDPAAAMVTGSSIQWTIPAPVANAIRGTENGHLGFQGRAHAGVARCSGGPACVAEVRTDGILQLPFQVTVP